MIDSSQLLVVIKYNSDTKEALHLYNNNLMSFHLFRPFRELDSFLGLSNQVRKHAIEGGLFAGRQRSEWQHLLHSIGSQANRSGEEGRSGEVVLDERALHDTGDRKSVV